MGINELIQIGSTIKNLRIEKGFSQKEMANKLGIPPTTYSNYENNHREPNIEILDKIATILDTSTEDMLLKSIDKEDDLSQLDFIIKTLKSMTHLMDNKEIRDKIAEYVNLIEENKISNLDDFLEELFKELSKYEK